MILPIFIFYFIITRLQINSIQFMKFLYMYMYVQVTVKYYLLTTDR